MVIQPIFDPDPDAKKMRRPGPRDRNHRIDPGLDQPQWEVIEELQRNYRQNRRIILS